VARVLGESLTPERTRAIDDWCRAQHVRCLYYLAAADDPPTTHTAEDQGFHLVDVRMTFERQAKRGAIPKIESTPEPRGVGASPSVQNDSAALIRAVQPTDVNTLRGIARSAYTQTRFYYDGGFPHEGCDALYETWITRSCEGYADTVLVAELAGDAVGYVTCHCPAEGRAGTIGLVGVSAQAAGRGLGQKLVLAALAWFAEHAAGDVWVVTQGSNLAAQRLYQRCGFLTRQVQLWYHKWYPGQGEHG
jgi:dTDP-4-amino-4,6-dideoxy-D-galactose acyltransferase